MSLRSVQRISAGGTTVIIYFLTSKKIIFRITRSLAAISMGTSSVDAMGLFLKSSIHLLFDQVRQFQTSS